MSAAEGGRVFRALGERIEPVDVEGETYHARAEDVADLASAEPERVVRLLPAFDQYVVAATRHAARFLDGISPDRVYRPQGWLSPVVLVNGKFAGVWRFERKGKRTDVTVEPFFPVSASTRKSVVGEIDRFTEFRGTPVSLEWLD